MRVSKGYEAGGDKKCKNSPESCVSGKLKCERARERAREGETERQKEGESQSARESFLPST